MKNIAIFTILFFTISAFVTTTEPVKLIKDSKQIDIILKKEYSIINQITCETKLGELCNLVIDSDAIAIDCGCSDAALNIKPNLKELGKWKTNEQHAVLKYAHSYFNKRGIEPTIIEFVKSDKKNYLLVYVPFNKEMDRYLFSYNK